MRRISAIILLKYLRFYVYVIVFKIFPNWLISTSTFISITNICDRIHKLVNTCKKLWILVKFRIWVVCIDYHHITKFSMPEEPFTFYPLIYHQLQHPIALINLVLQLGPVMIKIRNLLTLFYSFSSIFIGFWEIWVGLLVTSRPGFKFHKFTARNGNIDIKWFNSSKRKSYLQCLIKCDNLACAS